MTRTPMTMSDDAPNRTAVTSPRRGRPGSSAIDGKRTAAKRAALALLIEGKRVQFVAQEVGVNTKTVYAWMHEDGFANELDAGLQQSIAAAVRHLSAKAEGVAEELVALALLGKRDDMAKVKACEGALDRVGIVKRQVIETYAHGPEGGATDEALLATIEAGIVERLRSEGWTPPG